MLEWELGIVQEPTLCGKRPWSTLRYNSSTNWGISTENVIIKNGGLENFISYRFNFAFNSSIKVVSPILVFLMIFHKRKLIKTKFLFQFYINMISFYYLLLECRRHVLILPLISILHLTEENFCILETKYIPNHGLQNSLPKIAYQR